MKTIRRLCMHALAGIVVALLAVPALAGTCTAKNSGTWGTSSNWQGCGVPGADDTVIIPNSISISLNGNANAAAVIVESGGTLAVGGYRFQVSGGTTIGGRLLITSSTEAKTFTGRVTVNSSGEWNNSADEDVTFRGGLTNNGTFVAGDGVHTFDTNAQTLAGILTIPSMTVAGITLTNTGTLTVTSALDGTGNLTNAANAVLNIDFRGQVGIDTLTASAPGNLVNYAREGRWWLWWWFPGDQTIKPTTYHHLTLSGSDTKSLSGATSLNGNLLISAGVSLDATSSDHPLSVAGNFTNNGDFNARNGSVILNGASVQRINGSNTTGFHELIINNSTSGASGVVLARDATVSNSLILNQGIVDTGSNTLILSYACSATSPSGSSASFVAGFVRLTFPSGNVKCTYPVGDATTRLYAPMTVEFTGSLGGTLTGITRPDTGDAKQTAAGFDAGSSVNRFWTLTRGSLNGFTNYAVTLQFNNPADLDTAANTSAFSVRHYTGSAWITTNAGARTSISTQGTGITQNSFGDYAVGATAVAACESQPGLVCQCDNFGRSEINPSTIFGGNWLTNSSSGPAGFPQIAIPGLLRLTDNQGNESNSATVPGIFPAAGNYISVEFKHYAYNGSGADGVGVVLSDYSQPPTPGAFGGSLGFAQKTGISGFNYGWLGVALDEFGNYSNPSEGRIDGPGAFPQSVGIRGSGSGTSGYPWIGGALCGATGYPRTGYPNTYAMPTLCANGTSGSLDNRTSTVPSRGWSYQIVVDARNYSETNKSTLISVNRDTSGGSNFTPLVPQFDIYAAKPTQASVPTNWQITFTGSTGGSTNIHEIGALKVCASSMLPPTSTSTAGGFNAIDGSLSNNKVSALYGHIFMKLVGVPFKLNVAALATPTSAGVNSVYAANANKTVTVKLYDDSAGTPCNTSASACSACSKPVVAMQEVIFSAADAGFKSTANFTLDSPYKRLIAQMSDGTTTGCSTDAFSVRPAYYTLASVTSPTRAGPFAITATMRQVNGNVVTGSSGAPTMTSGVIPNLSLTTWSPGALSGTFFYNDVGTFTLPDNAIYDAQFGKATGEAKDQDNGDCNPGSTSGSTYSLNACNGYASGACTNASPFNPDGSGKYGCDIGSRGIGSVGRFYPDHYEASVAMAEGCEAGGFTYMGQPFLMTGADGTGSVQIKALAFGKSFADAALPSYSGGYSPRASVWFGAQNGASATEDLITRIAGLPAKGATASSAWTNGVYTAPASSFIFSRPTSVTPDTTWGSYDSLNIGVTAQDPDGSALAILPGHEFVLNGDTYQAINGDTATRMRYGRMHIDNAYGSVHAALPVNVAATYWTGSHFAINQLDTCTSTAGFTPSHWSGMTDGSTSLSGTGTLTAGTGKIILTKPSPVPAGRASVVINSDYLDFLPGSGKQTFGIYKSRFIYLREMY